MSWTNVEKSKTGDVQYDLESYSTDLTTSGAATSTTSDFNIIGYTEGTVSYTVSAFDTSITAKLEGSNDGANYFDLNSGNSHTSAPTTAEVLSWCIPCKYVRLSTTGGAGTNTLTNIFLNATAGGGGVIDASSGSAQAAGSDKEIQFNDGGFFGGASGALYDKTVNSDTGQIQIAAGTSGAPMISFSDGTHPAGNYDVGFYKSAADKIGVACGSGGDGMDIGVDDTSFATGSASTPSLNFGVSTAGSDSNTGMFQNGEDIVGFAAGGTELVNICVSASAQSTFIAGLNVGIAGNVVGLRRVSGTADCDWEDGHEGDSTKLWFGPSDFFPSLDAGFSTATYNVGCFDVTRGPTRGVSYGGITSTSTALCATKLIPKGFQMSDGEAFIFTNDSEVSGGALESITQTELRIFIQRLNITSGITGSSGLVNINSGVLGYTTNAATSLSGSGDPNKGDGLTSVCIYWDPGQQLSLGTGNRVLLGAYIDMVRI